MVILEMQTGVLSRSGEIAEQMEALEEGSAEWVALEDELHAIDDFIASEVKHVAGSRAFISTLYSLFIPFNPRIPAPQDSLREYYFNARTTQEQWSKGNPMVMPFDGRNAREAFDMVAAWAADDTGSEAKIQFLQQHGGQSSILAAIAPKTYWGKNGIPVWSKDLTEYFNQLEDGSIEPLPMDVLRYKIRSSQIQIEREMAIREKYGDDPTLQVRGILEDKHAYNLLTEEYDNMWRALEMEDDIVNDAAWAQWSEENADRSYIDFVANENAETIEAADAILKQIDLDIYPDDPREALEIAGQLKRLKAAFYRANELYNDGRYADWEVSPRQAILNEWYKQQGEYYDKLSEQYEKLEGAETEEERSRIYGEIARWRVRHEDEKIMVAGQAYPSPQAYSWNSKSPEQKETIVMSKLDLKPEWLTPADVMHIIEVWPGAAPYMPTSPAARDIFEAKAIADAQIAYQYRIGGPLAGQNDKRALDSVEEQFRQALMENNEFGVLEWLDAYPIENFSAFGGLPKQLEWMVPHAVAIHRQLAVGDKSPLTNDGKEQQRWMFNLVNTELERNPEMKDVFLRWGMNAFEESTVEGIVAQMLGNYRGVLD
jgi:hypothetical protein